MPTITIAAIGLAVEFHGDAWVAAGYFALAVVSAIVPWVNAELIMLSAVPLATSPSHLTAFVALVTAGQMTGKAVMYWTGRKSSRLQKGLERWRHSLERSPRSAAGITLLSSIVGLPPFYLVAIAAGALRVAFPTFLAVGTAGRFIHFALVALLSHVASKGW